MKRIRKKKKPAKILNAIRPIELPPLEIRRIAGRQPGAGGMNSSAKSRFQIKGQSSDL
jgi:hypothetical protein